MRGMLIIFGLLATVTVTAPAWAQDIEARWVSTFTSRVGHQAVVQGEVIQLLGGNADGPAITKLSVHGEVLQLSVTLDPELPYLSQARLSPFGHVAVVAREWEEQACAEPTVAEGWVCRQLAQIYSSDGVLQNSVRAGVSSGGMISHISAVATNTGDIVVAGALSGAVDFDFDESVDVTSERPDQPFIARLTSSGGLSSLTMLPDSTSAILYTGLLPDGSAIVHTLVEETDSARQVLSRLNVDGSVEWTMPESVSRLWLAPDDAVLALHLAKPNEYLSTIQFKEVSKEGDRRRVITADPLGGWASCIIGESSTVLQSGEMIIVGRFGGEVDLNADGIADITSDGYYNCGEGPLMLFIAGYDLDGTMLFARTVGPELNTGCCTNVFAVDEGSFIFVGTLSGRVDLDWDGELDIEWHEPVGLAARFDIVSTNSLDLPGRGPDFEVVVYPNPATGPAVFRVQSTRAARVQIDVYDALGRRRAQPFSGVVNPGPNEFDLDAGSLPPGIYFYRVVGENLSDAGSLVVL